MRPSSNPGRDRPVADDDEWDELVKAGLLDDEEPSVHLMGEEEISAEDGEGHASCPWHAGSQTTYTRGGCKAQLNSSALSQLVSALPGSAAR